MERSDGYEPMSVNHALALKAFRQGLAYRSGDVGVWEENGWVQLSYRGHTIMHYHPKSGVIKLFTRGCWTSTTKTWMNAMLSDMGYPQVHAVKDVWMIGNREFVEGMEVSPLSPKGEAS